MLLGFEGGKGGGSAGLGSQCRFLRGWGRRRGW